MAEPDAIDALVRTLGRDLAPVKRLRPPVQRAAVWFGVVLGLGGILTCFGDLGDVCHTLGKTPDMWLAVLGSTLTAALAAVAAFEISIPGRAARWALLPLPSLALWAGASGVGCWRTWFGSAAPDPEAHHCLGHLLLLSVPLTAVMVIMLRRACPLRPNLTAAVSGLAIAAAAAALLTIIHPFDASLEDLAAHLTGVVAVIAFNQVVAPLIAGRPTRRGSIDRGR